ncbi:MAG TPA: alpha/beta hydrolase [Mycobacterium sp.]|nr:alpha/beta hydrolase [Mycobacterium sp.]
MTLDPDIAAVIDTLNAGFPPVHTMTGAQARAAIRERLRKPAQLEPVGEVAEQAVPGADGDIPVRVYTPAAAPDAVVVFAHGGGFVFCDLDTHDGLCRSMCNGVGAVVVSVDYRLAPEYRWPSAADDVYTVTRWAAGLGGPLVVAGDSAGGNLAAVTTLMTRDRGGPEIAAQALLYPALDADFDTESYRAYATGYYNSREAMIWYWDQYVPDPADRTHPYAGPLHADLSGLPPAVVVTAGFDPLRTEGDRYATALAETGVPVVHRCYDGAVHGFLTMPDLAVGARAREQTWTDLRRLLGHDDGESRDARIR